MKQTKPQFVIRMNDHIVKVLSSKNEAVELLMFLQNRFPLHTVAVTVE